MESQLPIFRQRGFAQVICARSISLISRKTFFFTFEMPRQDYLNCKFLDHQAREGSQGSADNSCDDNDQPDMAYVSQRMNHPDGDRDMYLWSLSSQAESMGFAAPLNNVRRDVPFLSSFDPRVRDLAGELSAFVDFCL
jgi:hypothetical protein